MFRTLDKLHSHCKWIYINKEADTAEAEGEERAKEIGATKIGGGGGGGDGGREGAVGSTNREEPPQWIKRASHDAGRARGKDVNW